MIHAFYFRFFKLIQSEWISVLLAKIAYFFYLAKFTLKKWMIKRYVVGGGPDIALKIVSSVHPDPSGRLICQRSVSEASIDLSIIVPVYNYAKLIRQNIESILSQNTQYTYELILVDDGSTDGARDIVCSYADDPRVNVICQQNQGIAGARNTGLNNARGQYIMFVDCDDVVTSDIVETLMQKAYKDNCDIVMCAHDLVKERDGVVNSVIPNIYSSWNLSGYSKDASILNYAGLPWCKVYKRKLWENVRFLPGYWYEDTIIHALLFTQCKNFAYIPHVCYHYRWYDNNFSHVQGKRTNPKCIDRYWMLVPIFEQAVALGVTNSDCFYTMLLQHLSTYYYNTIQGMDEDVVEALFVLACDLFRKYRPSRKVKLPYILCQVEKSLIEQNINLWKLASQYQ